MPGLAPSDHTATVPSQEQEASREQSPLSASPVTCTHLVTTTTTTTSTTP